MTKHERYLEEAIKVTVEAIMPKIFKWLDFESFRFKTEEEKSKLYFTTQRRVR